VSEILSAVAMLSADNIFIHPFKDSEKVKASSAHQKFKSSDGDLLTLVSIFQAWLGAKKDINWCRSNYISHRAISQAFNIRQQLVELFEPPNRTSMKLKTSYDFGVDSSLSSMPAKEPFLKCLAAGLCLQIAKRSTSVSYDPKQKSLSKVNNFSKRNSSIALYDDRAPYKTLRSSQGVHIHPSSTLFSSKNLPEYVTYGELLTTTKQYMRNVTAIDKTWLPTVASHVMKGIYYKID